MGTGRIQDIPSVKKVLDDIHTLEQFKRALPLLKPFLRILGIRVDQMEAALAEAEALAGAARELAALPDRFNDLFASRGWIMYEMMNVQAAQAAVAKAEAGDIDGAEQNLVAYYDEQTVGWNLTLMNGVPPFRPRARLARLALVDYIEGRFHACVPVVLAQLDGMVNDLSPKVNNHARRGFFAEGSNLEAWDSIAAHSSGLATLAGILRTIRQTTTEEEITVPYRNGIVHGCDLGYDNKTVAAKSWAALFAARDWALKVERGQVTAQPAPPKPTWKEICRQILENADDRARLDAWVPRTLCPGEDIPAPGGAEDYEDGTPERRLAEFLEYWRTRNYGRMAGCLPYSPYRPERDRGKVAGQLRAHYDAKRLKAFTLLELHDEAAAMTVIKAQLVLDEGREERELVTDFRLLYEDGAGRPIARGKLGGAWKIFTYFI
jgi:hypothetical protein